MKRKILLVLGMAAFYCPPLLAAAKTDEKASTAFFDLGSSYFNDFKYPESVHYFKLAVEKNRKNWLAFEMLGEAYSRLRLVDDALSSYRASLRIHPHNPWVAIAVQDLQNLKNTALPDSGRPSATFPREKYPDTEVNLELKQPYYSGNTFDRDVWKPDFAFGLEILKEINPALLLGGRFDYFLLRADTQAAAQKYYPGTPVLVTNAGVLMKILQIMPELKVHLLPRGSVFQPFLKGGAGWMEKSFDNIEINIPSLFTTTERTFPGQNSFCFSLGAGLPLQISENLSLVLEYEKLAAFGDAGKDDIDILCFGLTSRW